MAFYLETETATKIAEGSYSDQPVTRSGFSNRVVTSDEKIFFENRPVSPIRRMILEDSGALRLASFEEQAARTSVLYDAILCLIASVSDTEVMCRIMTVRAALQCAYDQKAPRALLRAMINEVDFSDDAGLSALQVKILALAQWDT